MRLRKKTYTEAQLKSAVAQSRCIAEVIRNLGLQNSGAMSRSIRHMIQMYNIDISHFPPLQEIQRSIGIKSSETWRVNTSEVFCEQSKVCQNTIVKYYRKEADIPYECVECGNNGIYNSRPLVLQLDHINGISDDNRLSNLRWLCPNCHSQTATFTRRNGHRALGVRRLMEQQQREKRAQLGIASLTSPRRIAVFQRKKLSLAEK